MKYLNVKVLLKTKETVYRDFLLSPENTLLELHHAILESYQFKGQELASFLRESDGWQAAEEFPLEALGENDRRLMKEVKTMEVFKNEGDQLTYIYDYLNEWKFYIELIEFQTINKKESTPKLIASFGKAPKEDERELSGDDAASFLMNELLKEEGLDDEQDYDDPFESGDYDSLDDYEEFQ